MAKLELGVPSLRLAAVAASMRRVLWSLAHARPDRTFRRRVGAGQRSPVRVQTLHFVQGDRKGVPARSSSRCRRGVEASRSPTLLLPDSLPQGPAGPPGRWLIGTGLILAWSGTGPLPWPAGGGRSGPARVEI